ncbi:MAG: hypothetical protein R3B82_19775 [Sandaracinaceae bacterium]
MEAELGEHDGARYEERASARARWAEVLLVHDQAIDRSVALKRCLKGSPQADGAFLRRRVNVGALDTIVPVHDVGASDGYGRPYLVMKHVEERQLEVIIERLRAKDPAYVVRWSFEARIIASGCSAPSTTRTPAASCIGTSSPPTSWSGPSARSC